MLDTIVYIPTILAYAFVTLLLSILSFIVIYISHRIYVCIYDNLPIAQLSSSALTDKLKNVRPPSALMPLTAKSDSQLGRKSKTALRIVVTLEPCYLAFVVFETGLSKQHIVQKDPRSQTLLPDDSHTTLHHQKLIKYFDHLSAIPMGRVMQKCKR